VEFLNSPREGFDPHLGFSSETELMGLLLVPGDNPTSTICLKSVCFVRYAEGISNETYTETETKNLFTKKCQSFSEWTL